MSKQVTILLPNYKTPEITKLCVRLINQYTPSSLYHLIAIDNGSNDESSEYLKSIPWIEYLERQAMPGEGTALAHSKALDLGLSQVKTPYVLSIHTDTLVKNPDWLTFLINQIQARPNIAGVGSWKMENKPLIKRALKACETVLQASLIGLTGKTNHRLIGFGDNYRYLRSHCALYKTDLLKKHGCLFQQGVVAGKGMHKMLIDKGYEMVFLETHQLGHYLNHINHATIILNPQLGGRKRTINQGLKRVKRQLAALNAQSILANRQLDKQIV